MSPFLVFALVFTLLMLIYYSVMIALDLRKLGKKPSSNKEEFDVSSMQEEDESSAVDESQFTLPDVQVEENQVEEHLPEQQPVVTIYNPPESSAVQEKISQVESQLEVVDVSTSVEIDADLVADIIEQGNYLGGKFKFEDKPDMI